MKEVLLKVWEFLTKEIDGKNLIYKLYNEVIMPKLEEYVLSTESKWDDVMLQGINQIVKAFFGPGEEPKEIEAK